MVNLIDNTLSTVKKFFGQLYICLHILVETPDIIYHTRRIKSSTLQANTKT